MPEALFAGIVPSTDNGRSTGTVRRALSMPAPGDLRRWLTTLAEPGTPWSEVLEIRLSAAGHPDLDGVALGNLVLAALTQETGNLGEAALQLGLLLGIDIPVLPISVESLNLAAVLVDGTVLSGELEVRRPGKAAIREVFIEAECSGAWEPATEVLTTARTVILGPASLWTSIGAVLALPGVPESIAAGGKQVIFICNTTTQPGQTNGLDAAAHVHALKQMLGRAPDVVVLNSERPESSLKESLARDGLHLLDAGRDTVRAIGNAGSTVISADLLAARKERAALWEKLDTAYHDMEAVAHVLAPLLDNQSGAPNS